MDKQTAVLATEAAMKAKAEPVTETSVETPVAATPEPERAEVAENVEAADGGEESEAEEATASGDGEETTAAPRKPRKQNRFDQLTREKYEGIRRAEAAEARLVALEQQLHPQRQQQQAPTQQGRPTLEQFGYDQEAYETARDAWVISQARESWTQQQQQADAQKQSQERLSKFEQRIAKFEQEQPGAWDEVLRSPVQPTQLMREAVADSELGPKIAHYLATNLDEAFAITQLPPLGQAVAMGRIEAKLLHAPAPPAKPQTTVSRAPAPAPVIGSGASTSVSPEKMSIPEHMAAVRAKQKQRYLEG